MGLRVYTVHLPSPSSGESTPVLIREGFSWGAFILGIIWTLWHRLWIESAALLALFLAMDIIVDFISLSEQVETIVMVGIAVLIGCNGNDWRRASLRQRGYHEAGVVVGPGAEEALQRFLDLRAVVVRDMPALPKPPQETAALYAATRADQDATALPALAQPFPIPALAAPVTPPTSTTSAAYTTAPFVPAAIAPAARAPTAKAAPVAPAASAASNKATAQTASVVPAAAPAPPLKAAPVNPPAPVIPTAEPAARTAPITQTAPVDPPTPAVSTAAAAAPKPPAAKPAPAPASPITPADLTAPTTRRVWALLNNPQPENSPSLGYDRPDNALRDYRPRR